MSKVFDDLLLVKEYEQCEKCRIVANKYGCSDETVRRALIKYNVKRTKRHPRNIKKTKATTEELKTIITDYYESDATIKDLAKKLMVAKPVELVALAEQITKHKDNVREFALSVVGTAIEMLYKSYYLTSKPVFLKKIPKFLEAYDAINKNGHIKLHLVADLC